MTPKRAGDGLRKARTALLSGLMIAVFSLSITPTAEAGGSCSDDNKGGGNEPVSCGSITCYDGERFHVWIQASQHSDTVWAEGGCGGAEAFCGGTGSCNEWSANSSYSSLDGSCRGAADVGAYGTVELRCKAGDGDGEGGGGGGLPGIEELLPGDAPLPGRDPGGCVDNSILMKWRGGILTTTIGKDGECKTFEKEAPADDNGVVLLSL